MDVTLVCEVDKHLQTHRVILSATKTFVKHGAKASGPSQELVAHYSWPHPNLASISMYNLGRCHYVRGANLGFVSPRENCEGCLKFQERNPDRKDGPEVYSKIREVNDRHH